MATLRQRLQDHLDEMTAAREAGDGSRLRRADLLKQQIVAEELAAVAPLSWSRGRFTLSIVRTPRVEVAESGTPVLDLLLELRRDGVVVPVDGHIRVVNPPFRVPTGQVDVDGNAEFRDDPEAALKQIVWDVLAAQVQWAAGDRK